MRVLRSKELQEEYDNYLKERAPQVECLLCPIPPIKDFKFWKITDVMFPWDKIAKVHHMILPKRHIRENELTDEEKKELQEIKDGYINDNYDLFAEATNRKKSVPSHFHVHLVVKLPEN
jgi:hypothetical protein